LAAGRADSRFHTHAISNPPIVPTLDPNFSVCTPSRCSMLR
jgi:hypothetical protein